MRTEKTPSFYNFFPEDSNVKADTYNKVFTMCQAPFNCFPCINSSQPHNNPLGYCYTHFTVPENLSNLHPRSCVMQSRGEMGAQAVWLQNQPLQALSGFQSSDLHLSAL